MAAKLSEMITKFRGHSLKIQHWSSSMASKMALSYISKIASNQFICSKDWWKVWIVGRDHTKTKCPMQWGVLGEKKWTTILFEKFISIPIPFPIPFTLWYVYLASFRHLLVITQITSQKNWLVKRTMNAIKTKFGPYQLCKNVMEIK